VNSLGEIVKEMSPGKIEAETTKLEENKPEECKPK